MTPSKELLRLIDQYVSERTSAAKISDDIVALAEKEKIPLDEVAELIKTAFEKRGLSERQARRAMPEEFKRTYWKSEKNTTSDIMSDVPKPELPESKAVEIVHEAPKIEYSTAEELHKEAEPEVKASPLPYEVEVSGDWLWKNKSLIISAAQTRTKGYFSIYNGEVVGFESASTRRNRKVMVKI